MNVNKESFIMIRRGLMEHLDQGKMNGREFAVYASIHFWCDFKYGIAWKMSAPFLARFLKEKESIVKKCLSSLSSKGYIKRFNHRGQRTYYPVLINNYEVRSGVYTIADKVLDLNGLWLRVELNCTLTVLKENFKCPLNELYVSPIKEVNNIIIKEVKEVKTKSVSGWRINFDEYLKIVSEAFESIVSDPIEMEKQQSFHPNLDIKKSLEKAIHNFWGKEGGWKNKKSKRSKEIDMKMTLINNIEKNRVWKEKDSNAPDVGKHKVDF